MSSAGTATGINVTPLIDILLVLLIIFMVMVPVTPRGLDAQAPQPANPAQPHTPNPATIVVGIQSTPDGEPTYKINQQAVTHIGLEVRLAEIYSTRQEKVMFVQGDSALEYRSVAEVIDLGKRAGVDTIGIITSQAAGGR
jgi:biopolymer transport protein ExbD/biopolymer transport protein TolR